MTDTDHYRTTADLDGEWTFVTDPDDDGRVEGWYDPRAVWPDRAHMAEIPHVWQEHEEYREYTGTAWYRRTVDIDPPEDGRAILRFGAVDYRTSVWVDGEYVGSNRGGYLPFEIDVTDAAVDGENTIVVTVDDPEDSSEIPHGKQGAPWYQRVSGIWQSVTLLTVPAVRVDALRITPDLDDDTAMAEVDVTTAGSDIEGMAARVIVSRDDNEVARATAAIGGGSSGAARVDGVGTATVSIEEPDYWTPETPVLYDVAVELERDGTIVDRYTDYFGMRSIEAGEDGLYLNGDSYYIRGALDQGYYPETLYRPSDESVFEHEIRTAKELGFNLLRKHIKPPHPDFLELADRIGILVWEEPANPTVCTERSKREVRTQIRGLVGREYNRPSVIVRSLYNEEWGIGNPQGLDDEPSLWDDETKQAYLAELYRDAKRWDPTRLVCDNSGWAHVATDLNDYHQYFVSPDRAAAWGSTIEEMAENPAANYGATETDPERTPLLVSEFGTWGMCDLPAIEEYYGRTPPWFDYEFFDNPLKRPAGARDRFEASTLSNVFEDWSSLAEAWQGREYRSNKDVIEQMRTAESIAGYVVTEFTDVEWEFNGLLDYRREEKVFYDDFVRVNDDVLLSLELDSHAVHAGGTVEADLVVRNDSADAIDGIVEWSLFGRSGEVSIECDGFGLTRATCAISVDVPDFESPTTDQLTVSLVGAPTNAEPITAVPEPTADGTTVYADDDTLADALVEMGFETLGGIEDDPDVAVVTQPTTEIRVHAEDGGTVLLLPTESGHMADEEFFEYRALPEEESWNLVSSLFYTDGGPFAEYTGTVPGWELDGLYPYEVVVNVDDEDDVQVGYVEGWIANWSAAVAVREQGDGRVGVCTFRITTSGDQPVGTAALASFIQDL